MVRLEPGSRSQLQSTLSLNQETCLIIHHRHILLLVRAAAGMSVLPGMVEGVPRVVVPDGYIWWCRTGTYGGAGRVDRGRVDRGRS